MLRYKDTRCPILACSANKGERGCFCGFLIYGWPCDNPHYRRRWREETGYQEPEPVEIEQVSVKPHSLTARVAAAQRSVEPMTVEQARQMVLQLEVDGDS